MLTNPSRSWPNLYRFGGNVGQISLDLTRLDFGQNPSRFWSTITNLKPTDMHPKPIRPEPADLKLHSGRLRVKIFSTRCIRVEHELGINLTCTDPWTILITSMNVNQGKKKWGVGGDDFVPINWLVIAWLVQNFSIKTGEIYMF